MTTIIDLGLREGDVVEGIEVGLVHVVLVGQVGIDDIAAITHTKRKRVLCLHIVEVGAGAIG